MCPYIQITLPSYGVLAFIGAFAALLFLYFRLDRFDIAFTQFLKLVALCAVGCVLGSKLMYALTQCLCLVKKQNQNTSIDSSLPLFRSLKELAKICYNFQNSRTFDVAKPLYIMKGGLERYGFGRTI